MSKRKYINKRRYVYNPIVIENIYKDEYNKAINNDEKQQIIDKVKSLFREKFFFRFSEFSRSLCLYPFKKKIDDKDVLLPCGKCYYCKSRKSSEWANRIHYEVFSNDGNKKYSHIFLITLTYNNESLQQRIETKTLENLLIENRIKVSDVEKQAFFNDEISKRFKKDIKNYLSKLRMFFRRRGYNTFRYFLAFEYGNLRGREHIHILLFVKDNLEKKSLLELKTKIKEYWKNGFVDVKNVIDFSGVAQYVAKYVLKGSIKQEMGLIAKSQTFSMKSKRMGWDSYLDLIRRKEYDKIKSIPKSLYNWIRENDLNLYIDLRTHLAVRNKRRFFEYALSMIDFEKIINNFDFFSDGMLEIAFDAYVKNLNENIAEKRYKYFLKLVEKGKIKLDND